MSYLQKYPRTFHVPWSPGGTRDDRILSDMQQFTNQQVVVTEKMDGENTSIYRDHIHARSLTSADHPSRTWVKGLWGRVRHNIPEGWRVCGENLFARHSIAYKGLSSFFLVFSIWNEENTCLDWDSTVEWCQLLNLEHVPVIYSGIYDEKLIKDCWSPKPGKEEESEGYVIRLKDSFAFEDFSRFVAKYVRKDHVKSDSHWMHNAVVPNELKND